MCVWCYVLIVYFAVVARLRFVCLDYGLVGLLRFVVCFSLMSLCCLGLTWLVLVVCWFVLNDASFGGLYDLGFVIAC